ncbi:MAG TPA: cation-translocating P-type ATPase [Armatimonadota bacterium]|jgi:Cd2+/Zn2+-exporting ATPase
MSKPTHNEAPVEEDGALKRETYTVTGMDCGECAVKIDRAVGRLPGVKRVSTAFASSRLQVAFDPDAISDDAIRREVRNLGFGIHDSLADAQQHESATPPERILSMAVAGACLLLGWLTRRYGLGQIGAAFYAASILTGGWPVFRAAIGSLRARVFGDINVLMSLAVIGAVGLGDWAEGATVLVLFALGDWLEMYTMDRTRNSVRSLMALAPATARVIREGREVEVASRAVAPGETVRIRPGDRVPLDGEVIDGRSAVDQASVTGESIPVEKKAGDVVYAGTVNGAGALSVRVSRAEADSTIARIAGLVQDAEARKAPSERFVDQISRSYTPAIIVLAGAIGIVLPLALRQPFEPWFYRALVLLVAACPCALVISTPVAIVSAMGWAARRGILIKGGAVLEAAARVDTVAFDKTGTLTEGLPSVTEVVTAHGVDAAALCSVAAGLEVDSTHPLADAVRRYAARLNLTPLAVTKARDVPGQGVAGEAEGVLFWIGSLRSVERQNMPEALVRAAERMQTAGQTVLAVATESGLMGLIGVADLPRVDAVRCVEALRGAGVRRIAMLTGDARLAAESVARAVGVDTIHAELMPADKSGIIANLERDGAVAMVGDGVNDAPALAAATVGIAMGAVGSDAAIEAADIALMGDDLCHVPEALSLSRRTMRIIRQNVWVALALKMAFVLAVLAGKATLWMAVVADSGAAVLVTLNAMRLMTTPHVRRAVDPEETAL